MEIFSLLNYLIILLPSLILKLKLKLSKKSIWLIYETKDSACDNGYYLFKYIRENKKEDLAYYAIDKKSPDYSKVAKLGNVINWGSLKHYMYYLVGKKITTNELSSPAPHLFNFMHVYLNLYNDRVFLQRGITKDNVRRLHYDKTKFKLFVCGAEKEYEYIKNNYNYPNNFVKYLGFPRFDNFNNDVPKKQIFIMPTYRKYIKGNILNTTYYKKWNSLLSNQYFIDLVEKNNIEVYFYLHKNMSKYIKAFKSKSSNIKIIANADVNTLLKESSLLVTDYSSVYMDFAYMNKPVIYYQFDNLEYNNNGNETGYFRFSHDAFGKIVIDEEDLVKKIEAYIILNYKLEKVYLDRMNAFFKEKDDLNSKRVYEAIKNM